MSFLPIIVTVAFEGNTEDTTVIVVIIGSAVDKSSTAAEDAVVCKLTRCVVAGAVVEKEVIFVEVGAAVVFRSTSFANETTEVENDFIDVEVVASVIDGRLTTCRVVAVVENDVIVVLSIVAGAVDKNAVLRLGVEAVKIVVGADKLASVSCVLVSCVLVVEAVVVSQVFTASVVIAVVLVLALGVVVAVAKHNWPSHPPRVAKCWTGFSSSCGSSPKINKTFNN